MYQYYFGFKERPFQLVPNPAYLFLSRGHEEAMAHLTYATTDGDGFVAITGEVGTGKTTLCRAFIESLDDHCEVAYIFNPKLTAVELLQGICDEFGIVASDNTTTKDLIDLINRFLLSKKDDGKQVMLIIDEAQNLSREVLEQIRLLSNLETNTEKLLQIVLVGQPEMDDILCTYELRQLSQRITLNCYLSPLTYQETVQYIRHRIRLAARNEGVDFSIPAFRKIYGFSKGIPRLIHIVCDRALLTAYGMGKHRITRGIVNRAIQEIGARGDIGRLRTIEKRKTILLASLLCIVLFLLVTPRPGDFSIGLFTGFLGHRQPSSESGTADPPVQPGDGQGKKPSVFNGPGASRIASTPGLTEPTGFTPETALETVEPGNPFPEPTVVSIAGVQSSPLAALLSRMDTDASKKMALADALSLWGVEIPVKAYTEKALADPESCFILTAGQNGFQVHSMQSSLARVSKLNLPAIFEFYLPGRSDPYFLTLDRIDNNKLSFLTDTETGHIEITTGDIETLWPGMVHIPWVNFYDYNAMTPISGSEEDVLKLKQLLEAIGYKDLEPGIVYDTKTEAAVKELQRRYAIPMDGLVGPLTKIALYNEQPGLYIPHIRSGKTTIQITGAGGAR